MKITPKWSSKRTTYEQKGRTYVPEIIYREMWLVEKTGMDILVEIAEVNSDVYSALATNIRKEYFSIFELTEIMRQKDDKYFAQLLNRLREGKQTQDEVTVLKSRILKSKPGEPNYPASLTRIFN